MRKVLLVLAASSAMAMAGVAAVPMAGAAPTPTVLIVGNSHTCTGTYPTISAANAAAVSGDTIKVCAGTYDETVTVTTPNLTFEGARVGKKAKAAGAAATKNVSIIDNVNGDFVLASSADNTTINGFTIEGAGSPTINQDGVSAFAGSSGLNLTDNVIVDNGNGLNFQNPNSADPTTISRNYINNNNDEGDVGSNGQTGTGVFISNGPADNTTITNNIFGEDSQTAINFAGAGGNPSSGLVVSSNTSINDSTFVVATNSTNALIENNRITVNTSAVPGGNGTGILDFGSNNGLRIIKNSMSSTVDVSSAIALAAFTGTASADTTVNSNKIKGWNFGIKVASGYDSALVSSSTISGNGAGGIAVAAGTSGNVLSHNKVSGDAAPSQDCSDASTGTLTAGTANTWTRDVGADGNSSPAGIC
jgi:parallel beta-helix repeat protein